MIHVFCIMISLGGLVVINCMAATRYSTCSYYSYYDSLYDDKNTCYSSNKYANIAIIILGSTCMLMFVTFFFKLIAAFNNSQTDRE